MKHTLRVIFLFSLSLHSCINSEEYKISSLEDDWDITFPLSNGEVSIASLLKTQDSTYVFIDSIGQIYVEYQGNVFSISIGDLFDFKDINYGRIITLPANTYPAFGTDIELLSFYDTIDIDLVPQALTEILFKQGVLTHQVSQTPSNPNFDFEIQITFPEFANQLNNEIFSESISTGSGTVSLIENLVTLSTPNHILIEVKLILKAHASNVTIAETDLDLNLNFENLDFRYIRGYMGEQTAKQLIQDSLITNAFGNALNGAEVNFLEIKMELEVNNEYGVPVNIEFLNFKGINNEGELDIMTNPLSPVNIAFPDNLGETAKTTLGVINAVELLNFVPNSIYYNIKQSINFGAEIRYDNFIIDTSKLEINLNLQIPLAASAKGIVLADTISFDLKSIEQSNISQAGLKVTITNELPLDARLQFYFLDENGIVMDSLLEESQRRFIPSSEVDSEGLLENPGSLDAIIELDPERLNVLFQSKRIAIVASLSTSPESDNSFPIVRFLSQYKLKMKLGLSANLKVKVDL